MSNNVLRESRTEKLEIGTKDDIWTFDSDLLFSKFIFFLCGENFGEERLVIENGGRV